MRMADRMLLLSAGGWILTQFLTLFTLYCFGELFVAFYRWIQLYRVSPKSNCTDAARLCLTWQLVAAPVMLAICFIFQSVPSVELFLIVAVLWPLQSCYKLLMTPYDVSRIAENESSIARTMATNFFKNYLQNILKALPKLFEEFEKHEYNNKNTLKVHDSGLGAASTEILRPLLVLLIPDTAYMPESIEKLDPRISHFDKLDLIKGEFRRHCNDIYRIKISETKSFVCLMEFATPVAALRDYMRDRGNETGAMRLALHEQIRYFYTYLEEMILQDREVHERCCCVFYSDDAVTNRKTPLSEVIHQKLIDSHVQRATYSD